MLKTGAGQSKERNRVAGDGPGGWDLWAHGYGLVSRRYVIPANPRTQRQTEVRRNLADQARRFGELTDAQHAAWDAAAATYRSHPRQGQSGPLTGHHLFIKVNCKLALFGLEPLNTPPPPPVFRELAPQDLVIRR
jgi:hypothetical protein